MAKIPFTLDAWLKDKSQKVETRDGRPVRIIYWEAKGPAPIIGLFMDDDGGEATTQNYPNGRWSDDESYESDYDLFLVTPEPEMSEWELAIAKYRPPTDSKETIQRIAAELLALARKQLLARHR